MNIQDTLEINAEAISITICEYCTDNYIISYSKQLELLKYPENKEKLEYIVCCLVLWYESKLPKIVNEKYILTKENHIKSYEILKEIYTKFESNTK